MVNVIFIGRTCNCLFQYVFARLLAEKNGLRLNAEWGKEPIKNQYGIVNYDIVSMRPNSPGKNIAFPDVFIDDQHRIQTRTDWQEHDFSQKHVTIKGYFQHPAFYDKNKNKIKSWMILPEVRPGHENDIAVHIRLGDYKDVKKVPIISQKWYRGILDLPENQGKKVYLIMQQPASSWETDYVNNLNFKYEPVFGSVYDDFHFIRSFGTIVCSNSSFAWWAAFLSNAKKIYTFARWMIGSPFVKLAYAEGMKPIDGGYIWEN